MKICTKLHTGIQRSNNYITFVGALNKYLENSDDESKQAAINAWDLENGIGKDKGVVEYTDAPENFLTLLKEQDKRAWVILITILAGYYHAWKKNDFPIYGIDRLISRSPLWDSLIFFRKHGSWQILNQAVLDSIVNRGFSAMMVLPSPEISNCNSLKIYKVID